MENDNRAIETFINDIMNLYLEHEKYFNSSLNRKNVEKGVELVKDFRYALNGKMWKINNEDNHSFLVSLLQVFLNHIPDYTQDIEKVDSILEKGSPESHEIIKIILTNEQRSLLEIIRENEISMDFMTFFSIFSAYGYRNSLSRAVTSEYKLDEHLSGICPVCGHWPGMAYLVGSSGTRRMSCICCGTNWSFKRLTCSFCLTSDSEKLGYLNIEGEDEVSAYVCESCRRYLKTVRVDLEDVDLDEGKPLVDYLNTSFVDIAALQNNYVQESLLGTRFDGPRSKEFSQYRKLMTGA